MPMVVWTIFGVIFLMCVVALAILYLDWMFSGGTDEIDSI